MCKLWTITRCHKVFIEELNLFLRLQECARRAQGYRSDWKEDVEGVWNANVRHFMAILDVTALGFGISRMSEIQMISALTHRSWVWKLVAGPIFSNHQTFSKLQASSPMGHVTRGNNGTTHMGGSIIRPC